jgi:hypothetical protein
MSLWSTCAGVQDGFTAALCGPWRCHEAEEALDVVQLLCSDTLHVSCVDLDWPPLGEPSGVFLVVKEVGSRG